MSQAKVALVTGSSSGIGEAAVKLFSKKGYKVVVVGSKEEKVKRVADDCVQISPSKFQPLALVLDFSDPQNGEVAVKKTIEHFGRLDVLVNNAGVFIRCPVEDPSSYDAYRQLMVINTDATVKASLAAVEALKATKGNMVFVSSVASVKPSERGFAYCMSKAAMSILAKCLAIDLAPEIRVNIVSPGPVHTAIFERIGSKIEHVPALLSSMTLRGSIGLPDEIAQSIVFLASDEASFITGHELFIDGGYLIKPSTSSVSQQIIAQVKSGNQ